MSIEFSMKENISDGLRQLSVIFPQEAQKSSGVAALAIIQDALTVPPVPPVDTGYLRGSWFVRTKDFAKGPNGAPSVNTDDIGAVYGFNARYAIYQHENLEPAGPWKKGPKSDAAGGVGGKFLESKMLNAVKYGRIWAADFKKRIEDRFRKAV